MERGRDGRFTIKSTPTNNSESVSVFDWEPLKRVVEVWQAQQFEFKLARAWQVTEALCPYAFIRFEPRVL
jgi:hypothetical protein